MCGKCTENVAVLYKSLIAISGAYTKSVRLEQGCIHIITLWLEDRIDDKLPQLTFIYGLFGGIQAYDSEIWDNMHDLLLCYRIVLVYIKAGQSFRFTDS